MAATFAWIETNSGGVETTATNLNFGNLDQTNVDATVYPILAGSNSFEKYIQASFGGTFTSISELKFWMSVGVLESPETLLGTVAESGYAAPALADPVTTTSTKATKTIPNTEPSGANVGIGGSLLGSLVAPGRSDLMVLQLQVDAGAEAGPLSNKTFTMEWLEV